eukprot:482707-Ditylum_brightwellii.AAC.1
MAPLFQRLKASLFVLPLFCLSTIIIAQIFLQCNEEKETFAVDKVNDPANEFDESPSKKVYPHRTIPNNSWCPSVSCKASTSQCQPCARRFLFIIVSGRSGSTSLMHMVEKLPNVRIAGENKNALLAVQHLPERLHIINGLHKENDKAWKHHAVTDESLSCLAQSVMKMINPSGVDEMDDDEEETILAFNTIRFVGDLWNTKGEDQWSDVTQAVDLIKTRFPCSRVIVNIRSDTTRQTQSRNLFKGFKMVTEDDLLDEIWMLREVAMQFGEQAYLLDSSEWTDPILGVDKINGMIEWL